VSYPTGRGAQPRGRFSFWAIDFNKQRSYNGCAMSASLSAQSIVVASSDQLSADLAGEAAVLHVPSGTYFGLDEVGARIWGLLQQPRTLAEVRDTIVSEYDVDAARCEQDILELVARLVEHGLVEVRVS